MSKPRPPLPPMPFRMLNTWRFDTIDWWTYSAEAPLLFHNIRLVESWSGYAASVAGLAPAWLVFPAVDTTGHTNLSLTTGTVQFWFSPYWDSAAVGGGGPGLTAVLWEVGAWSEKSATGWWSLQSSPDGNHLEFVAIGAAGVEQAGIVAAPVAWRAGEWHQVALVYSGKSTQLYLDGQLAALGPGVALVPLTQSSGWIGFAMGSDALGAHLAQGEFDDLTTYGETKSGADIAANYNMLKAASLLGPITPEEEAARQAIATAGAGQSRLMDLGTGPWVEPCPELTVCIQFLNPSNYQNLQLTACGRAPGVTYSWFSTPDMPAEPNQDWDAWEWTAELRPEDTELVFLDPPGPRLFFQLVESPHFYVSANASSGGDGSQDLPFDSIGAALTSQAVVDGSVIIVLPGVYSGSNNRNIPFGDKDVALIAERGWENTIIDCQHVSGSTAFSCATSSQYTRGLVLGFTIANAGQRVVHCSNGSRPRFANCAFTNNSSTAAGGAVYCDNAQPTFLNCRFQGNSAQTQGGAIYGTGANSLVRISHCTFSDNARGSGGGTLYAANGARMELTNCIVWSSGGTEIATSGGGTVVAGYCDIAGTPLYPGTGNLNVDPQFETNGSLRLTIISPCIDRGTTNTFIDCYALVRHDMDGEARLDQPGENQTSKVDIGADEFVYRLPFTLAWDQEHGEYYSQVDEASGVAYLGSITVGNEQRAKFAVIDDEIRTNLFIYTLDATGSGIIEEVPVDITNTVHSGGSGVSNEEINDLEGITYYEESGHRYLLVTTSQTKRNRYRDVDNEASDPLIDPPSSDYDRRRNVMIRIELDAQYNPILEQGLARRTFWESENEVVPFNTGYDATNGLIAFIRQRLDALGLPFQDINLGNDVLIAWNTVNKFGTPKDGQTYTNGQRLPYLGGGFNDPGGAPPTAGTVLGLTTQEIQDGRKTLQNWATPDTSYYFKIWAIGPNNTYSEGFQNVGNQFGSNSITRTDGIPRLFINEFLSRGDGPDWLEIYNPAGRALDMGNISSSFGQLRFRTQHGPVSIPVGSWVLAHSYLRFIRSGVPDTKEILLGDEFRISAGRDHIYLENVAGTIRLDDYGFKRDQEDDVTEGRAWDGGSRGRYYDDDDDEWLCKGARFRPDFVSPGSPYPPTALRPGEPAANQTPPFKHFYATPDPDQTAIYLEWGGDRLNPGCLAA